MTTAQVQERTGLTRKAIRYYEQAGLLQPRVLETGYREFSDNDVGRLRLIKSLRELGVSVAAIKSYLDGGQSLRDVLATRADELESEADLAHSRHAVIQQALTEAGSSADEQRVVAAIERGAAALRRLEREAGRHLQAELERLFPGSLGETLGAVFGPLLDARLESEAEQGAWRTLTRELDELEAQSVPEEVAAWVRGHSSEDELQQNMRRMWARYDVADYREWEAQTLQRFEQATRGEGEAQLQVRMAEQEVMSRFFSGDGASIMAVVGRWLPLLSSRFRRFSEYEARFMREHPALLKRLQAEQG